MHLKNGAVLKRGEYRIEKLLGQGGFGITYLAVQSGLDRKVAIKEFFMKDLCERDADTSSVTLGTSGSRQTVIRFKEKFIREAKTIASLRHPNIVNIHDVFEENGTAYYVMEYHDGGSLSSLDLPLSVDEASDYIRQIASALSYLHKRNTMHLDVKPSNILLDESGNAVLIDFGVSKHYDGEGGSQTSSTPVGLSRGYAPLEQGKAGGVSQFTPATDIYALGATFYKLVTGQTPPDANDVYEDGLPAFPPSVPSEFVSVIEKSMQPRRKDRPQSIKEFLAILDSALQDIQVKISNNNLNPSSAVIQSKDTKPEPSVNPVTDSTVLDKGKDSSSSKMSLPSSKKKSSKWKSLLGNLFGLSKDSDNDDCVAPTGYHNDQGYVDLGLPSGLKWATCNVGASKPGDYGNYYGWGSCDIGYYFCDIYPSPIPRSFIDTAFANWGGSWRLPTKEEFQELIDNCDWTWTTQNRHKGYMVTAPNGNSIFLPASGCHHDSLISVGAFGHYWSSNRCYHRLHYNNAVCLTFSELGNYHSVHWYNISCGLSVRPVLDEKK
ncbi:MAG: serine/threonine protein kinase [Bacteroidales bacterium]|nr:serine/threonine protein kinase [Bacteroidales bacterium]